MTTWVSLATFTLGLAIGSHLARMEINECHEDLLYAYPCELWARPVLGDE